MPIYQISYRHLFVFLFYKWEFLFESSTKLEKTNTGLNDNVSKEP